MADTTLPGIDVSHHNESVDWSTVASSGIVFAFAKASEGRNTRDAQFQSNFDGMGQSGIIRGAYHFFHPELDAKDQAANFLAVVASLSPGDLPPVLDVETDGGQSAADICTGVQQWMDIVENALGRTPILYTMASFWNAKAGASQDFGKYPLWIAHYTTKPVPAIPSGWSNYAIWQYSETGSVPGISGSVDLNRFNGTLDDLKSLAGS